MGQQALGGIVFGVDFLPDSMDLLLSALIDLERILDGGNSINSG